MHQRGGIELAVFKAFGEILIEALSFGFRVAELVLTELLVDGFSLVHTMIYDAYKHSHNQEREIKVLSLSLNRK